MKQKILLVGIFFLLFAGGFSVSLAHATDAGLQCTGGNCTYAPLEPLPGSTDPTIGNSDSFFRYLNLFIKILIIVGAMIAVVRFSIGGIIYMTSEIAGNRSKAKSQMWACIWGLLLLVSSVLILNTISPSLVNFNFFTDITTLSNSGTTPR